MHADLVLMPATIPATTILPPRLPHRRLPGFLPPFVGPAIPTMPLPALHYRSPFCSYLLVLGACLYLSRTPACHRCTHLPPPATSACLHYTCLYLPPLHSGSPCAFLPIFISSISFMLGPGREGGRLLPGLGREGLRPCIPASPGVGGFLAGSACVPGRFIPAFHCGTCLLRGSRGRFWSQWDTCLPVLVLLQVVSTTTTT